MDPDFQSMIPAALRPNDAALRLGIGRTLMYEMIGDGRIRTVKLGRARLVPVSELRRLLAEVG